jgi:hypothetical protein
MRAARSLIVALLLLLGPAVSQAFAVSIRDLVELNRAGLGDAVLVALIETDGSRFTLNADDIRDLKSQGLSDAVIVAMIRTKRRAVTEPPPLDEPTADQVYSPAPPAVIVHQTVVQKVEVQAPRHDYVQPVYVPVYIAVPIKPVEVKKEEPVYWGWGGKRRPDAWKDPVIIK